MRSSGIHGRANLRTIFFVLSLLSVLPLFAYFNTFNHSFHYDDPAIKKYVEIKKDHVAQVLGDLQNRSILQHAFSLNFYFSGNHVFGYHLANFLIHIMATIMVFVLLCVLLRDSPNAEEKRRRFSCSLLGALLFGLSPMSTQAVTYIISRSSSLAALFYMISLLFFLYARRSSAPKTIPLFMGSFAFFILGIGTKEIVVTLPAVAILSILFFSAAPLATLIRRNLGVFLALICLALAYLIFRSGGSLDFQQWLQIPDSGLAIFSDGGQSNPRLRYLVTELNVIPYHYLRLLFFPFNQNLDPDFPHDIPFFSFRSILALSIISFLLLASFFYRRHSAAAFMVFWFFITLLPTSSIVPLADPAIEHHVYLPSIGFFSALALAPGFLRLQGNFRLLSILILLLFSTGTMERNRVWVDDYTLWSDAVSKSPHKSKPHNNLGGALFMDRKDYTAAIGEYQKAISLNPNYVKTHKNLAAAYFEARMFEEAVRKYEHAYLLDPKSRPEVSSYIGDCYLALGDLEKAEKFFLESIQWGEKKFYCYGKLGTIYQTQGDLEKAKDALTSGLALAPRDYMLSFQLAEVQRLRGDFAEAEKYYLRALRLLPDFREAMINLGLLYKTEGRFTDALPWLKKVVDKNPDSEMDRINLGLLYKEMRAYGEALGELHHAIRINPANASTFNLMGAVYFLMGDIPHARESFAKALELRPDFPEARNNLEALQRLVEGR